MTKFVEGKNYAHYFVSNSSEKIDLNENCRCWFLVEAILVRCLPQNLIIHDERWFTTLVFFFATKRKEKTFFLFFSFSSQKIRTGRNRSFFFGRKIVDERRNSFCRLRRSSSFGSIEFRRKNRDDRRSDRFSSFLFGSRKL